MKFTREDIVATRNRARLNRKPLVVEVLGMVIAEIDQRFATSGKQMTETEIVNFVRKEKERYDEMAEAYKSAGNLEQQDICEVKAAYVDDLLPKQMDEDATAEAVETIIRELGITDPKRMGVVMKTAKERHGNEINMKLVSQFAKKVLTK